MRTDKRTELGITLVCSLLSVWPPSDLDLYFYKTIWSSKHTLPCKSHRTRLCENRFPGIGVRFRHTGKWSRELGLYLHICGCFRFKMLQKPSKMSGFEGFLHYSDHIGYFVFYILWFAVDIWAMLSIFWYFLLFWTHANNQETVFQKTHKCLLWGISAFRM